MRRRTSLYNSGGINSFVGPAGSFYCVVPIQFDWSALWKDNGCVQQTCDGIEGDEGP